MATDLELFRAYRQRLMAQELPFRLDAVVWLQGDWLTLAAAEKVEHLAMQAESVLLLGNDVRIWRDRAPRLSEMAQTVAAKCLVINNCGNTLEQAKAFWQAHAGDMGCVIVCNYDHVPRVSLTFECQRKGDAKLYWAAHRGVENVNREQLELSKIHHYAKKGDCLPLAEAMVPA